MKHPCPRWYVAGATLLLLFATVFWARSEFSTFDELPGRQRDDVFYDSIAFNLLQGDGFSLDFSNEKWLKPYRETNPNGIHDWIFEISAKGPTAVRPPAWPAVMAASYYCLGRRFDTLRWLNIMLVSLGLTYLLCTLYQFHGRATALLAAFTLALDFSVLRTAGQLMTEALSITGTAILFAVCAKMFFHRTESAFDRQNVWRWLILGIGIGVLTLIRTNVIGWTCLWIALAASGCLVMMIRRKDWKPVATCTGFLVLGVVIVASPWWIRNCYVTGQFEPFGTAANVGAAGYYSDYNFANNDEWDLDAVHQAQAAALANHNVSQLNLAEQEYLIGIESKKLARNWIRENVSKLPMLMLIRARNHLGIVSDFPLPVVIANCLILFGAVIGILVDPKWGRWIGIIFLLSLLVTVLTFSHQGRYSLPVRPLLHVACAIGTVWFWKGILSRLGFWKPVQ